MTKVAILGGGVGAMTATLELTSRPDWKERFESVTVYQMGWRLGGKGASGRGPDGRIEEHGLHIWLGMYENAFRAIRRVYAELGREPGAPLATWEDAFHQHSFNVLAQEFQGRWTNWVFDFPTNEEVPGDGGELPSLWSMVVMTLDWMRMYFERSSRFRQDPNDDRPGEVTAGLDLLKELGGDLETAGLSVGALLLGTAHGVASHMPTDHRLHSAEHHGVLVRVLDAFRDWFLRELGDHIDHDLEERRTFILLDLAGACLAGIVRDGVLKHHDGLEAIDGEEFLDWLKRHGASDVARNSPVTRGLYDFVFAFRNGDLDRPSLSAGIALRIMFRMCLTYKGAIFWKMQAGMGDTIFGPIYQVLKQRGVTFEFFHRVTNLGLAPDGASVATIRLGRQATPRGGSYDPLVPINGLPCWPSEPRYEALVEGDRLKAEHIDLEAFWTPWQDVAEVTLEAGKDFDVVVLGLSVASLPFVCPETIAASERWKTMVQRVETVQTMALQLWLDTDLQGLGWPLASPVLDAFADPLNSWADMTHLVPREAWPPDQVPRNISYFCGPLAGGIPPVDDLTYPERTTALVYETARHWLETKIGGLWPKATADGPAGPLRWDLLVDLSAAAGEARLRSQFWRANTAPSERYVLSVPGSTAARIPPGDSGFKGLFLAGDWTSNGFNAGCVEAAVMSGMLAANAICGSPRLEEIVGLAGP